MRELQTSEQVIETIRRESDTVLLSFSCGKDSIAAWLALRDHFPRVIPFYLYLVPNLRFVNESLDYFEHYFGCHILRYPHPSLYRMLGNHVFQSPERTRIIDAARLTKFDFDDIARIAKQQSGVADDTWMASGVRVSDTPARRAGLKKYGAINATRRVFYPVWDWNIERLENAIRAADLRLPVDYRLFGRSFDGIGRNWLEPLRDSEYRDDYERILEFFPLAELDILRKHYQEQYHAEKTNAIN